eukprot:CAMPEP_0195041882 /NCGR_PEP_ID=MMETSP0347-20130606/1540_1 /TAXON_ID=2932 /ORGANISM="Alexandrium fundyense, Strain CCMP1719" /LENGTH=82 /DNA_ID=CAMNT_0040069015 /DNA_START=33 /DNA_END=278 /DNA_ORIENTATION=+
MPIRVRNTFIDTSGELSPSLECFYQEREVRTCPSAHIGRLSSLFNEADVSGWGSTDDTDSFLANDDMPETRSVSEASPCNVT